MMPFMPSPGMPKTNSTPQSIRVATNASAAVVAIAQFPFGERETLLAVPKYSAQFTLK
jgi:hypothetical protein